MQLSTATTSLTITLLQAVPCVHRVRTLPEAPEGVVVELGYHQFRMEQN